MRDLDDKLTWFRDDAQRDRVRALVRDRLADDRSQDECRYLLRFCWHLVMGYREVSHQELAEHVSAEKLARLELLFEAVDEGFGAIDRWIEACARELPTVEDRTWRIRYDGGF